MDYTIKAVKASGSKDPHGNEWFSVLFESGEQASWLAKTEPQVGDTVYGNITEETKKSGEGTYKRFRKAQKDVTVTGSTSSNAPYKMSNEDPGRQDSIIRQSSMKAAVDLVTGGQEKYEKLFDLADEIVKWVKNEDKVKEIFPEAEEVKEDKKEEVTFMDDEVDLELIPF